MWLNEFKVALITQDTKKIGELVLDVPEFKTQEEQEEAYYLYIQSYELLTNLKNETLASMKKMKDTIAFIESSYTKSSAKLDIMQ